MNDILTKLARFNPKVTDLGDTTRIALFASSDSHPKRERIEIDVDAAGKVVRTSKYSYLLPESVGAEIRGC